MMMFGRPLDANAISDCVPDWPSGPLDTYRNKATFNWKQMKLLLEGEDVIRFKTRVWNSFKNDPLFARTPWDEPPRDEERKLTFLRLKKLSEFNFVDEDDYIQNPYLVPAFVQSIGQYDWSLCLKRELSTEYFILSAKTAGNNQQDELAEKIKQCKALGAIVITELSHGSDTKMLQTRATFDPSTQEFILNTPNLEATKVWSGNLGKTATHAVVFAQLCTSDDVAHGIHQFMVPIRDPATLLPYAGLMIGDMGGKIGLNGLDNGFMQFKNYRIPKDALMNKTSNLSSDGVYKSRGSSSGKFGKMLGILSCGRVFIIMKAVANLQSAITIAVRYSAVRKQFGPDGSNEWPVIEYQTQQWRLFPYVACSFVLHNFFITIYRDYVDFLIGSFVLEAPHETDMGSELHIVSCCAKAMCGWLARDAIQEGREACGGHGYLKSARFGELRNDHDANNTYEGDNHVLLQQTSNHLIKLYKEKIEESKSTESPFGSFNFLNDLDSILKTTMNQDVSNIQNILESYQFMVCWLLKQSYEKLDQQSKLDPDLFVARSQTQVYYLRSLSMAFFEANCIHRFIQFLAETTAPDDLKKVLSDLGLLYALWSIEKYIPILYASGYIQMTSGRNPVSDIQNNILRLCENLKCNAVALVDVFSPPDFILNSSLGISDGRIYEQIFDALSHNKNAFDRPEWFREFTDHATSSEATTNDTSAVVNVKSKL